MNNKFCIKRVWHNYYESYSIDENGNVVVLEERNEKLFGAGIDCVKYIQNRSKIRISFISDKSRYIEFEARYNILEACVQQSESYIETAIAVYRTSKFIDMCGNSDCVTAFIDACDYKDMLIDSQIYKNVYSGAMLKKLCFIRSRYMKLERHTVLFDALSTPRNRRVIDLSSITYALMDDKVINLGSMEVTSSKYDYMIDDEENMARVRPGTFLIDDETRYIAVDLYTDICQSSRIAENEFKRRFNNKHFMQLMHEYEDRIFGLSMKGNMNMIADMGRVIDNISYHKNIF